MRLRLLALAVCLFAITAAARADVVTYTLTIAAGSGFPLLSEFNSVTTFEEPSILTTTTDLVPPAVTTTTNIPLIDFLIDPVNSSGCPLLGTSDPVGCIDPDFNGVQILDEFEAPFTSLGTYTDGTDDGITLSITQTPEPSSMCLLGTGLLGLIGAARRRFS